MSNLRCSCKLLGRCTPTTARRSEVVAALPITLKHGPIKKLEMEDPMTMVFRVQDPAMLKQVKVGDKVKFDADRVNGQFTITKIEKSK
jgi:Cu(I)/Ag(I) efflux system protein CusF